MKRPCLELARLATATSLFSLVSLYTPNSTLFSLSSAQAQTTSRQKPAIWQETTSTEGGFSVFLPGKPSQEEIPGQSEGDPTSYRVWLTSRTATYAVQFADFQAAQLLPEQIKHSLNAAPSNLVNGLNGKLLKVCPIQLGAHPGREVVFSTADGLIGKARIYQVNSRFYIASILALSESVLNTEGDKFLGSFKLLSNTSTSSSDTIRSQSPATAQPNRDQQIAEAENLLIKGTRQFQANQFQLAIELTKQALKIYQDLGDSRGRASALNNLGLVYIELQDYSHASENFKQALAIGKEINDREVEAKALGNLGILRFKEEQIQEALNFYEKALKIAQEIGDLQWEASLLV
ncbi:MAG: tetratricopeptide repeat protein [Tildeniella nuda ZEHNDER 1965/U140]|jgi:tetratricopeptide (TPR) repeat protein|nr:tetratricopeptide repeat protein [Tildeniella nuda ZEHNDER 1965/U140]